MEDKDQLVTKIKNLIPDEEQRLLILISNLSMGALITDYLVKKYGVEHLPLVERYACGMLAANMLAFISDGREGEVRHLNPQPYKLTEQNQEAIYRKMKNVIVQLYNQLEEDERVL